jgi:hypothetical protein
MLRHTLLACATLASALTLAAARRSVPAACTLVTAQDATKLAGFDVTQTADNGSAGHCRYHRSGTTTPSLDGVEVTVRSFPDAPSAHAAFPRWVVPFPTANPNLAITPLTGVGDEASIVRPPPAVGIGGVYFRQSEVLVKIGVHPAPSDAALTTAAKTVVSRM